MSDEIEVTNLYKDRVSYILTTYLLNEDTRYRVKYSYMGSLKMKLRNYENLNFF